jgi:hypothetical protein
MPSPTDMQEGFARKGFADKREVEKDEDELGVSDLYSSYSKLIPGADELAWEASSNPGVTVRSVRLMPSEELPEVAGPGNAVMAIDDDVVRMVFDSSDLDDTKRMLALLKDVSESGVQGADFAAFRINVIENQ